VDWIGQPAQKQPHRREKAGAEAAYRRLLNGPSRLGAAFFRTLDLILLTGLCLLGPALALPPAAHAQAPTQPPKSAKNITAADREKTMVYEDRLRFYLNIKTKNFLLEMAGKEQILLQSIANITVEVKRRGIDGLVKDEAGFEELYKKTQTLTESYTAELEAILAVIDEISALSRTLERERRHDLADRFQDLKGQLVAALDNRELYKKAPATRSHAGGLMKEFDVEVDSLLRIYNHLEKFRKTAVAKGDTAVLPLVEKQKHWITQEVARIKPDTSAAADKAQEFLQETERISDVLAEMDKLEKNWSHSLEAQVQIDSVRHSMLSRLDSLDSRLLKLLSPKDYANLKQPTLEEHLKVWRGARLADYETRAAEYAVMKKRLLESGNVQGAAMLEGDLTDALLNYAAARCAVAELQFTAVLRDYESYFSNWEAVYFYHAESIYARGLYPSAYERYEELLRRYPNSKFLGLTLLRLVTIAHTLKWEQPFLAYYQRIDSSARAGKANTLNPRIVERARYLAGYFHLQTDKYAESEAALSLIPPSSQYHFAAQYLRGIAQANLGNLSGALQHFQLISDSEGPMAGLTDPTSTLIRNNAMMRLGFIHYQRGELETRFVILKGFARRGNYDQTLIGL
jgi:tetratricopeptide (TPR) repeat protein